MTDSKKEQRQALNRFLRGQAKETKRERDVGINVRVIPEEKRHTRETLYDCLLYTSPSPRD